MRAPPARGAAFSFPTELRYALAPMKETQFPDFVVVGNDEVSQFAVEFALLCDRLNVCEEIREGYYSDEARVCDLFDMVTSNDEIDTQVAALDLLGIRPESYLIDALRAVRNYGIQH